MKASVCLERLPFADMPIHNDNNHNYSTKAYCFRELQFNRKNVELMKTISVTVEGNGPSILIRLSSCCSINNVRHHNKGA